MKYAHLFLMSVLWPAALVWGESPPLLFDLNGQHRGQAEY
jgi:hypothetical protein